MNNSSTPDILSLNLESKSSGGSLDRLSSISSIPAQVSSPSVTSPIVDLLDGLSASQPTIGMLFSTLNVFSTITHLFALC